MTNLWKFSDTLEFPDEPVTGFDVYATEGAVGTVEAVHRGEEDAYLVVRTGKLKSTTRMIPAGVVRQINPEAKKVFLAVERSVVKHAPEFDPSIQNLGPDDRERLAVPFVAHT